MNALVGSKIAIVADKPQTTRTAVQGVWNAPGAQIVFLDTPGIHRSGYTFQSPYDAGSAGRVRSNAICSSIWPMRPRSRREEDAKAIDMVRKASTPSILV